MICSKMDEYTKMLEHSRKGVLLNGRMILKRDKIPHQYEDIVLVPLPDHSIVNYGICGSVILQGLRSMECVFVCTAG